MSSFSRVALCALLLSVIASSASAQHHPVPSPTAVPCTTCLEPNTGKLIYPYSTPIKSFRGRFVDSTDVKDWPLAPRTIRARGTIIVPQLDRIYMILGSGVAAYTLSTFFSSRISQPMTVLGSTRFLGDTEKWLVPDAYWYAEMPGSGWDARSGDGQDRLYDIDADDRGYVYPACGPFGWGVLNGNGGLQNMSQYKAAVDGLAPSDIRSLRSGSKYYAIVSDFASQEQAILYDVTNPSVITKVVRTNFAPYWSWTKVTTPAGNNILGALNAAGNAYIYTVDGLLNGTGPAKTFPGSYNFITSDGTNFYAVHGNAGTGMKISTFSPSVVGEAATYSESVFNTGEAFAPHRIRYARGYLTITGLSAGHQDLRLYRLEGTTAVKVDVGDYFKRFYVPTPTADYVNRIPYVNPTDAITYTDGSRDHIIFSGHGVGDVYELFGNGVPPPPIAPDPNIIVSGCARLEDPCSMTARSLTGASETGWACTWTFNGVGFDNPVAGGCTIQPTFLATGTFAVVAAVTNALGSGSANTSLTVGPKADPGDPNCSTPPPNFVSVNLAGTSSTCNNVNANCAAGETVTFFPGLFGGSFKDCDQFAWNFGDGATAVGRTVTHAFANGVYVVSLTVSNTAGSSIASPATVTIGTGGGGGGGGGDPTCNTPPPNSGYISVSLAGTSSTCNNVNASCAVGETVTFFASLFLGGGAFKECDQFSWTFGDGASATGRSVTHAFSTNGAYTVRLTVSNTAGTSVPAPAIVTIGTGGGGGGGGDPTCNTPPPNFVSVNLAGTSPNCNNVGASCSAGETVTFFPGLFGGSFKPCDQFAWNFGDGATATGNTVTHAFSLNGVYTVRLTVSNPVGSSTATPATVTIGGGGSGAKPTLDNLFLPAMIVAGTDATFTAVSSAPAITRSDWNFGDGSGAFISNGLSATHKYAVAGNYDIKVSVTNASGTSSDVMTINITVKPPPPPPTTRKRGSKR